MKKRPLILVTNDDGVTAKGIKKLVEIAQEFGEVTVVAPDSPQSGKGHAITIGETLRVDAVDVFKGIETYACSGTPADCVKMAKHLIMQHRRPDLVLSGINHGSNASISVLYSGTMSAAIEAALEGIPAIGFSYCDYNPNADMSHVEEHARKIISEALNNGIPEHTALNVNFPIQKKGQPIKGIRLARQASARWQEAFDERYDPNNRKYYWLSGEFLNFDKAADADINYLDENYTTVVPCQFDLTNYNALRSLAEKWEL